MSELKPCAHCGKTGISYTENEDWGFVFCDNCNASVSMDLEDLPDYHEQNAPLDDCEDKTKQPLIDKWNTRASEQQNTELKAQVEALRKAMLYEAAETREEFNVPDEVTLLLEVVAAKNPQQSLDTLKAEIEEEVIENCRNYILDHYQSYFIVAGLKDMPRKYPNTDGDEND